MATSETLHRTLSVRRAGVVRETDTVRHVDQLSDAALDRFLEALESGSTAAGATTGSFEHGEVVVFTDFYRIELG